MTNTDTSGAEHPTSLVGAVYELGLEPTFWEGSA